MWLLASLLVSAAATEGPVAVIPNLGSIRGLLAADDVAVFRGIPYAKAPVGDRRWRSPEASDGWTGVKDATAFGSRCTQSAGASDPTTEASVAGSEDCLFVNVATPRAQLDAMPTDALLPVVVWIHGGAYTAGNGEYPLEKLVARTNGLVMVSMNYRVNVFGFLGSDLLQNRNAGGTTGNFGIEDQRLAMAWTKANIGAFGGDGNNITIMGLSAGGSSVINHLAQKSSFPYYGKAVILSGAYFAGANTLAVANKAFTALTTSFQDSCSGLSDIDCLLSQSAAALLMSSTKLSSWKTYGPVVDGVSLTKAPLDLIALNDYNNQASVMIGSTRDETAFFFIAYGVPKDLSEVQMDQLLLGTGGGLISPGAERFVPFVMGEMSNASLASVKEVYAPENYEYPANMGPYSRWYWMLVRITTETVPGLGLCGVRDVAHDLLKGGTPAVFTYQFENPMKSMLWGGYYGTGTGAVFAPHATEALFVFNLVKDHAEEADLGKIMSGYWSSFAISGDPNEPLLDGPAGPYWPRFEVNSDTLLRLDVVSTGGVRPGSHTSQACDYQDQAKCHSYSDEHICEAHSCAWDAKLTACQTYSGEYVWNLNPTSSPTNEPTQTPTSSPTPVLLELSGSAPSSSSSAVALLPMAMAMALAFV